MADDSVLRKTIARIIKPWEGGLIDHPSDPGGFTNMGITIESLQDYYDRKGINKTANRKDIINMDTATAESIYKYGYWIPAHCVRLPNPLAVLMFDGAINTGVEQVTYDLQQALDIKQDGIFGPQTEKNAKEQYVSSPVITLRDFAAARAEFYALLDDLDDDFGYGWMRRLFDCYNLAQEVG